MAQLSEAGRSWVLSTLLADGCKKSDRLHCMLLVLSLGARLRISIKRELKLFATTRGWLLLCCTWLQAEKGTHGAWCVVLHHEGHQDITESRPLM